MASKDSKPHLTALSRNNDLPSESELQEAFELRSQLQEDLLQVDTEIRQLKEKRAGIQKSIDTYNIILSPARRLLPDILQEIFYHCLPDDHNPTLSAKEAPILLTRICSVWRIIALTSPLIWARIHIPLPGTPSLSSRIGIFSSAANARRHLDFSKAMELRCQVVKDWLTRSGTCPLSISLSYPTGSFGTAEQWEVFDNAANDVTEPLFRQILSFSSRWKHVELSMPFSVYQKLESHISGEALPLLNSLRGYIERNEPFSQDPAPFPLRFLEAPNLQRLSLYYPQLPYHNTATFPPIWSRLTDLHIQTSILDFDFYNIISLCRNLITCQVDDVEASWRAPDEQLPPQMEVIFPNLQLVRICESGGISHVVQAINAPRLKSLNYRSRHYFDYTESHPTFLTRADGLFTLVEKGASTLRKLTLEPQHMRSADIMTCLRLANKVSHLVLRSTSYVFNSEDDTLGDDFFDLHLLTIHKNVGRQDVLLPKLEVLEVDYICQFTDEDVLHLLTSRLDAARHGDVVPLRRLKLQFARHRQRDITKEGYERAKSAGYELSLELDYPPDGLRYAGRLSPSFAIPIRRSFDEAWPPVLNW